MNKIYGLLSSATDPIPLLGVKVEGDILGRGARVKIFQRFRNQEEKAVEAVYKFPLPEDAAVCGFSAATDGKKIQGQVEERDKAFDLYDDALARGDGGYLLDEERPNIFTLSVGNLNPDTEVMVEIEYVILLDMEGREVRFFLPTTISPRYIPDGMAEDDGIPESDKLHPPYSESVPYGLSTTGELVLRKIPVPVTIGWHGTGSVFGLKRPYAVYAKAASAPTTILASVLKPEPSIGHLWSPEGDYGMVSEIDVALDDRTDVVLSILSLQRAGGGMELDEQASRILRMNYKKLAKIAADLEVDVEVDRFLLLSTAVLLQVLAIRLSSERATWASIVGKSENWLKKVIQEGNPRIHGKDLMTWAEQFVKDHVRI